MSFTSQYTSPEKSSMSPHTCDSINPTLYVHISTPNCVTDTPHNCVYTYAPHTVYDMDTLKGCSLESRAKSTPHSAQPPVLVYNTSFTFPFFLVVVTFFFSQHQPVSSQLALNKHPNDSESSSPLQTGICLFHVTAA